MSQKNLYDMLKKVKEYTKLGAIQQGEWLRIHHPGIFCGGVVIRKGCFFGCLMQRNDSYAVDEACTTYGLPKKLGSLLELLFECLPERCAENLPVGFLTLAAPKQEKLLQVDIHRWFEFIDKALEGPASCRDVRDELFNFVKSL